MTTITLFEHTIEAVALDDEGSWCRVEIDAELRDIGGAYEPTVVLVRARAEVGEDVWREIGVAAALEWLRRGLRRHRLAVEHELETQVSDAYDRHKAAAREREEMDSYGD